MGRVCQVVIGPAGSGKSTYCHTMQRHFQASRRSGIIVNLDPAAEKFHYQPTIDIRSLITLQDVMDELNLGPNGGLVFCMEYLLDNIEWLEEEIGTEWEDEYLIVDCPGQIELFTHSDIMKRLITFLQNRMNFRVCVVYLLETQFIADPTKFFSGVLTAMSAMIQLEVPHINVLSKMDLIEGKPGVRKALLEPGAQSSNDNDPVIMGAEDPDDPQEGYANTWSEEEALERDRRRDIIHLERYLDPCPALLIENMKSTVGGAKWRGLNDALAHLIEDFDMVSFLPLNIHDEESMDAILYSCDLATQFGEDLEPKEVKDFDLGGDDDDGANGNDDMVEDAWREALR